MKIYMIALLALLAACTRPIPCPPFCAPPPATPTSAPTTPTATPTAAAPSSTPTPRSGPSPPPVEVRQLTSGRAVVQLDLRGFVPPPNADYFALATLMWSGQDKHAPALELSVRGTEAAPCLALPCGPSRLGLVARFSGDIASDHAQPDERLMCGEGIKYSARLPIGSNPLVDVTLKWDAAGVLVTTPTGASRLLKQGSPRVGFGAFFAPVPSPPKGVGWAYGPALVSGRASLLSWEAVGEQGAIQTCP